MSGLWGVAFDPKRYRYSCQAIARNHDAHVVTAKDGREAYFEIKGRELYAFLSHGLNVEIWRGLLVVGAPKSKELKRERSARKGRKSPPSK
jgi:hypothetical protein